MRLPKGLLGTNSSIRIRLLTCALLLASGSISMTAALAQEAPADEADTKTDEIIVYGRGEKLIDTAQQASQGTIQGADLRVRPLSRVGEIVEAVPGMIAA